MYEPESSTLWLAALGQNVAHSALDALQVVLPANTNAACVDQHFVGLMSTVTGTLFQLSYSDINSATALGQLGGTSVNLLLQGAEQTVTDCGASTSASFLSGILADVSKAVVSPLAAGAAAGDFTQRFGQLIGDASPLETGFVAVSSPLMQVARLQISCSNGAAMLVSQQQTCSVTALDTQGNAIPASQLSLRWSIAPAGVLDQVGTDPNGTSIEFQAASTGQATLTVQASRLSGGPLVQQSRTVTVSQAALSSLIATPSSLNVPVGGTYKIVLQGVDSLGNAVAVSSVTWGPSTGSVATAVVWPGIANAGQVQAVGAGNVTVTASANGVQVKIPVTVYTPATAQTSISLLWGQMVVPATGLSYPDEVAVDGIGNIYVGDYNGGSPDDPTVDCTPSGCVPSSRPAVTKLDPLGNQTAVPTSGVCCSYGVAVDRSNNVYIADEEQNRIVKVTSQGAQTTLAPLCEVQSVVVDNIGNVYAWGGCPGVDPLLPGPLGLVKINPQGTQSFVPTTGLNNISSHFAVDANGNVYVSSNGNIVKIDSQGNQTIVASGLGVVDRVRVDASGNLYMTQQASGNSLVLLKQTSGGVRMTLGSGLSQNVQGIAVDGNGNVYVMDTGNIRALKIQPGPSIEVGIAPIGQSTQATLTYQIAGGATVGSVTATGASNTSEFSVANGSGCVSTNGTCSVLVNFVPAASGMRTGSVTLYDQNQHPLLTTAVYGIGR